MTKQIIVSLLLVLFTAHCTAQNTTDSTSLKSTQWNYGLTISPQMLFVGGLDLGIYTNVEHHLQTAPISLVLGMDIRNKWYHANISNSGLDTRSLKTHYSLHAITYGGVGFSFKSKDKKERNSFYLTGTPYYFAFKESVSTAWIANTSQNSSLNFNAGILWTSSKVTKSGRIINTQFYLPIFSGHLLDELRVMSLRIGFTL